MMSQVSCVGLPHPKSWDDFERGCLGTYRGGHTGEAAEAFCHGMQTVFNLLRNEFPPAEQCKAAPDLLAALKSMLEQWGDLDDVLNQPGHEVVGWHLNGDTEPVGSFFRNNDRGAVEKAESAIAKATGEES